MSQQIINKAWLAVGVKDETRAAIESMRKTLTTVLKQTAAQGTQALQPLNHALQQTARGGSAGRGGGGGGGVGRGHGTGGFGAGGAGARQYGAFAAASQFGFLIEDATVSYQLNGLQGAVRAGANNFTMLALALGSVKAQMAATAAVVTAILLPSFLDWATKTEPLEKRLERIANISKRIRDEAQQKFDVRGFGVELANLSSPKEAESRREKLAEDVRQTEQVDRPTLVNEIALLRASFEGERQEFVNAGFFRKWADTWKGMIGSETDLDRLEGLKKQIEEKEAELTKLDKQTQITKVQEKAVEQLIRPLETSEAQKDLRREFANLFSDLDPLVGPEEAGLRANRDRNAKLEKLFGKAGIETDIVSQLAQLDRLRANGSATAGLPSTLDQSSVGALQQFSLNQQNQNSPLVRNTEEIKRIASSIRSALEELLSRFTEE